MYIDRKLYQQLDFFLRRIKHEQRIKNLNVLLLCIHRSKNPVHLIYVHDEMYLQELYECNKKLNHEMYGLMYHTILRPNTYLPFHNQNSFSHWPFFF
jgi:hypothetical protein